MSTALRCPKCHALVVDRRFPNCTTCHEALPPEWLLTPDQIEKLQVLDEHARHEHAVALDDLDSVRDPNTPLLTEEVDPTIT